MSKIALQNIDNFQNEATTVAAFNNNNALIRAATDNTLSRDGTAPNQMNAPLDMNSKKIINLPDAITEQEPVTLGQLEDNLTAISGGILAPAFLPTFTQTGVGAVARTILNKIGDAVNAKDFGAVCDGVTDDRAAINAALAAFDHVVLPQGTIKVSGPLTMGRTAQKLSGAGRNFTRIVGSSTSGSILFIPGGTSYIEISDLTVDRSVVPDSSGIGIQQIAAIAQGFIHDVEVQNQYYGLAMGGCSYGQIFNIVTHSNYSHGLALIGGTSGGGTLQWNLDSILSSVNNGDGYCVTSLSGTTPMVCGEPWRNITSYANAGYGIGLRGSATAYIADFTLEGGFLGSDGLGEIFLDTYSPAGGVQTSISNIQMEFPGQYSTGRGAATPASNVGHGIEITANNRAVNLRGICTNGVSQNGVMSSGPLTSITNSTFTNSGTCGTGTHRNGIEVAAGSAIITNISTGNDGGTTQQNGILLGASSGSNIVANNNVAYKSGSVVAGIVNSSTLPLTNNIVGNIGYNPMQLAVGASNLIVKGSTAAATVAPVLRLDSDLAAFATAVPSLDFTYNGSNAQILGRVGSLLNGDFSADLLLYGNPNGGAAPIESFRIVGLTGAAVSKHPTGGIGYGAGAGGTVTQATNKATGVTLSKASGQITMNGAALAAGTIVSFVLTNTAIAATDVLILNHISGGTPGAYSLNARCAAGSATIDVRNNTAGSLSEAIVIQFAIIKAVNA